MTMNIVVIRTFRFSRPRHKWPGGEILAWTSWDDKGEPLDWASNRPRQSETVEPWGRQHPSASNSTVDFRS